MAEPSAETSVDLLDAEEPREATPESSEQKQPRRRRRRNADSFATYLPRVLKNVHQGLSLSQQAVSLLDSLVKDMFECIVGEAALLLRSTRRSTVTSREIQMAVCLLLPGNMGKLAMSEATKALLRYARCK